MDLPFFKNRDRALKWWPTPVSYETVDRLQREMAEHLASGLECARSWFLFQALPVMTLGYRGPSESVDWASGLPVLQLDRGGLTTVHGPGQWILFPVETMERGGVAGGSVKYFCSTLLQGTADWIREKGIEAWVEHGAFAGVWTERGKVASLGIRVRNRVVQHGIAFNLAVRDAKILNQDVCGMQAAWLEGQRPARFVVKGPEQLRLANLFSRTEGGSAAQAMESEALQWCEHLLNRLDLKLQSAELQGGGSPRWGIAK